MPWAVVHTYGGQEEKAVVNLLRQGFEAFCPRYVRASDARQSGTSPSHPLFPSYAFVQLDLDSRWASINSTLGVIRLLTSGPRPSPRPSFVADSFIDGLDRMGVRHEGTLLPNTVVRVRRIDSPLYDLVGTVVGMANRDRVRVLMSLMSRDTVVEFEVANDLEVVA